MMMRPWFPPLLLGLALAALPLRSQEIDCFRPITLGINGEDAALIRSANASLMRITLRWSLLEPSPGVTDFENADRVVASAEAAGVRVLAILSSAPQWAGSNANGTRPAADVSLWRSFVRRVAERYAGRIAAYEIWNEPNFFDLGPGIGWAQDLNQPPRYIDYVRAAAEEIRSAAPEALVVAPNTSSLPDDRTAALFGQLEEVFSDGRPAADFVDAVSFHANALDDEPSPIVLGRAVAQLDLLTSRNPRNAAKPVWITELGWKSNQVGELGQRDRIESLLNALSSRCGRETLTHAFIFQVKDVAGRESRGVFTAEGRAKLAVSTYLATLSFPATTRGPFAFTLSAFCENLSCEVEQTEWLGNRFATAICSWDFGDGSRVAGRECRATHTYADAASRVVDLTVTIAGIVVHRQDIRVDPRGTCRDIDPPRVAITTPAPGADLKDPLSVLYLFRDNLGFTQVELLVDGQSVIRRQPPPFMLIFEPARFGNGPHRLQVALDDLCGNRTESVPVEVFVDRRPPTVTLLAPSGGTLISGRLPIRAEARDDRAVARVEFLIDGKVRFTDTAPPYEFPWASRFHLEGEHRFAARAFDRAGNAAFAGPARATVDNTPPVMHVSRPAYGATIAGDRLQVTGWAVDRSRVSALRFALDGREVQPVDGITVIPRDNVCATLAALRDPRCPNVGFRTELDVSDLVPGSHTLTVRAEDGAGNVAVTELRVMRLE